MKADGTSAIVSEESYTTTLAATDETRSKVEEAHRPSDDTIVVDWDGPDDPNNPLK